MPTALVIFSSFRSHSVTISPLLQLSIIRQEYFYYLGNAFPLQNSPSIVEENKIKRQQQRKLKPPSIKINDNSNQENKQNDENKMKQPSIKEFVLFTKKKIEEKEKKEMEENQFPPKDPEDKSREASIM